jgi:hypothetical protein
MRPESTISRFHIVRGIVGFLAALTIELAIPRSGRSA